MSIINTSFRPRPIDINRPLEIFRGNLPSEADGCVRGVPSLPTGMEPEEEEVRGRKRDERGEERGEERREEGEMRDKKRREARREKTYKR